MALQLTFDGREVEHVTVTRSSAPLNLLQRQILHVVRDEGLIRTTRAGVMAHTARGSCGYGKETHGGGSEACCAYAATDGLEVLKRLANRGLLRRTGRGVWTAL